MAVENTNKVKFGLKNVHYAKIIDTAGVITYAVPKPIKGAVTLTLNVRGESSEFYADDIAYFVAAANNGYEGDLEVALIPDEFRIDILGDALDKNDVLFEDAEAIPEPFALLYEFAGDKKATRHINYHVTAGRPNIEGGTKTETIEPQTETLNIIAAPAKDGKVKARVLEGQTPYENFYEAVYTFDPVVA